MHDPTKLLAQPGEVILNKYQVLSFLGAGRYGQVFQVRNRNLGKISALKIVVVDDPDRHKAVVEAQAQSLCGHDHVVEIRTADVFDGSVLIEMEFIEGGSLGDRLAREFVPVMDCVSYLKQVLYALEHAHARGIVHRDIKPGNIMLAPNRAKLSDFGTAMHPLSGVKVIDEFYLPHASPETAHGDGFSALSDVFAAGLTLMRSVNNMAAWSHIITDDGTWRDHVVNGTIPDLVGVSEHVPPALRRILRTACAPDRAQRFQSATAFRQALERLTIVRRWKRLTLDEWGCEHGGRDEAVRYLGGPKPRIEYLVNGRRKQEFCKVHATERDARRALERIVAQTTLACRSKKVRTPRAA
jgi:serine/threonine-protein kinase